MFLYREFPPCPGLAAHVDCFWTARMAPGGAPHRVLPDNRLDILWQDSAPGGFVAGMMSRSFEVAVAGPVRTVAVRFLPGAAADFFVLPLAELADRHAALADLWPPAEARALADSLWSEPLDDAAMLRVLEAFLLRRLARSEHRPDRLIGAALDAVAAGDVRVEVLARQLGVSRQHLAARFRARVGLGLKTYARVARFQRTLQQMRALTDGPIDWPALACDAGYYDQSHLIHDFRSFAALSPQAYATRPRRAA